MSRTIYFSKRFDSGTLRGIVVHGSITFPPECLAHYIKTYRKGTTGREALTRAKFTIVDASFQKYTRD